MVCAIRTDMLATMFTGSNTVRFLPLGLRKGPCICDSSERYRRTTNPNPWRDCYNNRWNVKKEHSENLSTGWILFVLPLGRMWRCTGVSKIKSMSFSWTLCNFIALSFIVNFFKSQQHVPLLTILQYYMLRLITAGPGFDPRRGSKFSFENFQPRG